MNPTHLLMAAALSLAAFSVAASPEKSLVCHVGNQAGPAGEVYLDDPGCVPGEDNGYVCPDAGKVDLILVASSSAHLGNSSHSWDGIADYDPAEVGASGDGTEDSDGNGVDDGCEPPLPCPCWAESDLLSVTAANHLAANSCSAVSNLPLAAIIQKFASGPVGVAALAAVLSEETETIEDVHEPFLLRLGFIDRTPQGRVATDLGRAHLSALGYEIPPPRRGDGGMPSLWDEPVAPDA